MRVRLASEPGSPDRPNEDFAAVTPGVAVLLDGAGEPPGTDTGCVHGIAWYSHTLGGFLAGQAGRASGPLTDVLAAGVEFVNGLHAGSCDLGNPRTPGATVVMARQRAGNLENLVLADSVLLLQPTHGDPQPVSDDRLAVVRGKLRGEAGRATAGDRARHPARQTGRGSITDARNQPGGFWLAAADPAAASRALTSAQPIAGLSSVTLLSDGASRLADMFGMASWADVCAILAVDGPGELIRQVRAAEASDPACARWPRTKASDDATAIYWHMAD